MLLLSSNINFRRGTALGLIVSGTTGVWQDKRKIDRGSLQGSDLDISDCSLLLASWRV